MSFNRSLWTTTGSQIGREARAFMNAGNAWSTYWAPVINLAREPRWGRNIETPGEDPYLTGEYASAFTRGFQQSPDDPYHLQASACCKHYAANSMESSTVAGVSWNRHNFNASVTQQDLVDSYMAPFQACVEKGKVSGLMCSYNAINGIPSCANDWLLTTVARESWDFDGYITSDCDADADVFNSHHYTDTPEEAVRDVLRAGTDVDCTSFVGKNAQSALDKKLITMEDIETRLRYLFKVRMRLSHFDPKGPLDEIPTSAVCSKEAIEIAKEGSAQGTTLLKNDGTLPLKASSESNVAVIGPNIDLSKSIAGYYGGNTCDNKYYTMIDAVQQHAQNVTSAKGVPTVTSNDTSGIADAVKIAEAADKVILVVGTDLSVAREGHDAVHITFSEGQSQLIAAVAEASKAPVVIVTLTAVPLDISDILKNDKIGAIVHAGQPSVQTLGVGDVLFGIRSPAGRTIQTIYPASYADQISIFDFNMRPGPSVWPRPDCPAPYHDCKLGTNPGRTHRFYTGEAVVPFGYGLSYTKFKYDIVKTPRSHVSLDFIRNTMEEGKRFITQKDLENVAQDDIQYAVKVTNVGDVDSDDVVLGFAKPPGAGQGGVPLQTLFGFERVHVPAGKSVTVYIYPEITTFTAVDINGELQVAPGQYEIQFGVADTVKYGGGFAKHTLHAL